MQVRSELSLVSITAHTSSDATLAAMVKILQWQHCSPVEGSRRVIFSLNADVRVQLVYGPWVLLVHFAVASGDTWGKKHRWVRVRRTLDCRILIQDCKVLHWQRPLRLKSVDFFLLLLLFRYCLSMLKCTYDENYQPLHSLWVAKLAKSTVCQILWILKLTNTFWNKIKIKKNNNCI